MLADKNANTNIAVKDIDRAQRFYAGTLGLKEVGREGDEFIAYESGDSMIFVYRSEFAGTNKATAMTWIVGDKVQEVAHELKLKGVQFEHYDMPGMKLEDDVHVGHGMKVAWFKDPDGNILNIASG
jgi:catechol 2,3-dioxygenase-like lactoylglutathione lyase family enzyme